MRRLGALTATLAVLVLITGACAAEDDELTPINLQLQWVAQAQFAGYYAAVDQGFYADEGLDVTILEGAVEIVPQQVVATGGAEFGLAWVPKALVSNEEDAGLVNVGQVFQRSGTLMVSWADSGITSPSDWEGKIVGNWGFGNEYELTAAIEKFGVNVGELVAQSFDMEALLNREIDAAEAMIYNEYAQVLEATNPATGELYQPSDLTVIDFNDPSIATAMLQDAIWVTEAYAEDNADTVEAFLRASFRGWIYCRDNPDSCVDIVLAAGPTLGRSHQTWQMNEINGLIWPSPLGIGVMDGALWQQTVDVATSQGVIQGVPPAGSYRTDFAQNAVDALEDDGLDTVGNSWQRVTVELNPGGE
ncbi:MAG: ABC transporter substrate-binding protein [Acidimicrobiia bacterium]|nr:ABC transporter substrate-binding protein [Acidimicrobiia bacterium]MYC83961.1 ABC transporter substrate-binding protein [Acidimicrobiia bacterium]